MADLDLDALCGAVHRLPPAPEPLWGDEEEVRDYLNAVLEAAGPSTVLDLVERVRRAESERDAARADTRRLTARTATLTVTVEDTPDGPLVRVNAARHLLLAEIAALLRGEVRRG